MGGQFGALRAARLVRRKVIHLEGLDDFVPVGGGHGVQRHLLVIIFPAFEDGDTKLREMGALYCKACNTVFCLPLIALNCDQSPSQPRRHQQENDGLE